MDLELRKIMFLNDPLVKSFLVPGENIFRFFLDKRIFFSYV